MIQKMPGHAKRMLTLHEAVIFITRPRLLSLNMFMFMIMIVLVMIVFSIVVEPGYIRLLAIPAFPVLGSVLASLVHAPVIFVSNRRVVLAQRFLKPFSVDLDQLKQVLIQQTRLGRLLRYGDLLLLLEHPQDRREGVFMVFKLTRLSDAAALRSAISKAAGAIGIDPVMSRQFPKGTDTA